MVVAPDKPVFEEVLGGSGLILDMAHAADAVEQGLWVPQDLQASELPARFGYVCSPQALRKEGRRPRSGSGCCRSRG